jgi:protocatechuate 3,4-dioxygenase beta subunit
MLAFIPICTSLFCLPCSKGTNRKLADVLNMPIPEMRIIGTITDKLTGQPVTGALVSVERVEKETTNSQFSIINLPGRKGKAILRVDVKGYGKKIVQFMVSETGSDTQVDVQLGPCAMVIGRVVDSEWCPIAGATVEIIGDYYQICSVKTDAEGKYQLEDIEVRQDAYRLFVDHLSFIFSSPTISVNKTGIVEAPDVVLTRCVTLKGRVTDEFGKPIQGAKIKAYGQVKTNANGEFYIKDVPGTFRTVVVDSPNFMPAYKKVRLDTDKEIPPVDFVLKPGKTLIGYVVDEQGKPIEGVMVQLRTWKEIKFPYDGQSDYYVITDANGEFRLEHLPENKITLNLFGKEGYFSVEQPVEIEPDQPITTVEKPIVMQKVTHVYAKVVDAETGKPIKHFRVKAASSKQLESGDIPPDGLPSDWTRGFAFQSDMGEFKTFKRLRGMVIALQVEAEDYAPIYVKRVVFGAYDKEPLIIRMNKRRPIEGIVVGAETGKPLAGALISTFDKNHPLFIHGTAPEHRAIDPVRTDEQGNFALPGALAEEFYLYVTHPEHAAAIVGPLHSPTDERLQPISVEMQKGCVVMGTAEPEQQITLFLSEHHPHLMVELTTRASREGYRFENLMPGKYHIEFAHSGTVLELQPGETKTFNFQ